MVVRNFPLVKSEAPEKPRIGLVVPATDQGLRIGAMRMPLPLPGT